MPFQTPRVYNTTSTGAVVSGSSGSNFQFGFLPQYVRIENLGSVNLWAKLGTTGVAATSDILITTCAPQNLLELRVGRDVGIAAISLASTSTGTSAYNIFAIG